MHTQHTPADATTPGGETRTGSHADVVIIGGGMMGATVARGVRAAHPDAVILIVDTGPRIGPRRGQHLHDVRDDAIWKAYNRLASRGSQAVYVGAQLDDSLGDDPGTARPGMYDIGAFGGHGREMPGAAVGWNTGGMAIHWTAATPWPFGPEQPAFIDETEWQADLQTAQAALAVNADPYGSTPAREAALRVLGELFDDVSAPDRHPKPMPMALNPDSTGQLVRTSPSVILPALADGTDPALLVLDETTCVRLLRTTDRVTGAVVRHLRTGVEQVITGDRFVVAADTLRTPQLLWASGIRVPALGRRLNEHAMLTGRAILDTARHGVTRTEPALRPREWNAGSTWLPASGGDQPFQAQVMDELLFDTDGRFDGYSIGLTWYVPTEIHDENRIEFSDELDPLGLPRMRLRFRRTAADEALILRARADQARTGYALGSFDPERDTAVLTAGSSLHLTGTVRMGPTEDGTSVCDPSGQVWGSENLFVAGGGAVPTALAANSSLTGAITAVRAARAVSEALQTAR